MSCFWKDDTWISVKVSSFIDDAFEKRHGCLHPFLDRGEKDTFEKRHHIHLLTPKKRHYYPFFL